MMDHSDKKSESKKTDRGDGVEKDARDFEDIEGLKLTDKEIGEDKPEGVGELDSDKNKIEKKLRQNTSVHQPNEGDGKTIKEDWNEMMLEDFPDDSKSNVQTQTIGENEENQDNAFTMLAGMTDGQAHNEEHVAHAEGNTSEIFEPLAHAEEHTPATAHGNPTFSGNAEHLAFDMDMGPSGSRGHNASELNQSGCNPVSFTSEVTLRNSGVIVELRQTYGFIYSSNDSRKVFFHFSDYMGNINLLKYGDLVQFKLSFNLNSGRSVGCEVYKLSRNKPISEERLVGHVASEIPTDTSVQQPGFLRYRASGHSVFFPFYQSCVENKSPLCNGDKVNFHIAANCSGTLHAYFVRLLSPGLVTFSQNTEEFVE